MPNFHHSRCGGRRGRWDVPTAGKTVCKFCRSRSRLLQDPRKQRDFLGSTAGAGRPGLWHGGCNNPFRPGPVATPAEQRTLPGRGGLPPRPARRFPPTRFPQPGPPVPHPVPGHPPPPAGASPRHRPVSFRLSRAEAPRWPPLGFRGSGLRANGPQLARPAPADRAARPPSQPARPPPPARPLGAIPGRPESAGRPAGPLARPGRPSRYSRRTTHPGRRGNGRRRPGAQEQGDFGPGRGTNRDRLRRRGTAGAPRTAR